ncbi:MAG: undecaprenyl diphosphate synthase family protein [Collinsella aerofaciens]
MPITLYGGSAHLELVIRTSGELRVSKYLLWQIAYSEFISLIRITRFRSIACPRHCLVQGLPPIRWFSRLRSGVSGVHLGFWGSHFKAAATEIRAVAFIRLWCEPGPASCAALFIGSLLFGVAPTPFCLVVSVLLMSYRIMRRQKFNEFVGLVAWCFPLSNW